MGKALVIAPDFFGYEKELIRGLMEKGYEVTYINAQQYAKEYFECWNKSPISIVARHLVPFQRERDRKRYEEIFADNYIDKFLAQINETRNYYDLIFTVNSDLVPDRFYSIVTELNPKARKVLYLWDDLAILSKKTYFRFFDDVYSYNITDCRKNGFRYMPVFVQETGVDYSRYEKEYDIAIIGSAHTERVRFAKRLYKKYKDKYKFMIYFLCEEGKKNDFFCKKEKLSYEDYMILLAKSKAVVDYPLKKQKGPTTRVYDAVMTHTKVITISKEIKYYPVYNDSILVLNERSMIIPELFIGKPYKNVFEGIVAIDDWLDVVLL